MNSNGNRREIYESQNLISWFLLLTIINSIAVTDLLGIVPYDFIIPTVTFLI